MNQRRRHLGRIFCPFVNEHTFEFMTELLLTIEEISWPTNVVNVATTTANFDCLGCSDIKPRTPSAALSLTFEQGIAEAIKVSIEESTSASTGCLADRDCTLKSGLALRTAWFRSPFMGSVSAAQTRFLQEASFRSYYGTQ